MTDHLAMLRWRKKQSLQNTQSSSTVKLRPLASPGWLKWGTVYCLLTVDVQPQDFHLTQVQTELTQVKGVSESQTHWCFLSLGFACSVVACPPARKISYSSARDVESAMKKWHSCFSLENSTQHLHSSWISQVYYFISFIWMDLLSEQLLICVYHSWLDSPWFTWIK